jgi:thiamine-phosphate pyrophosphorylase
MSMQRLLNRLARLKSVPPGPLPRLLVLTDSARGFDLAQQQKTWPSGAGFIERTFGQPPSAPHIGAVPLFQLATCSGREARRLGLNGVHWPHARLRSRRRSQMVGLLETASAHSGLEIALAARAGVKAILISPAFASNSPSAQRPMGPHRLAKLARSFPDCALFALGGVTEQSVRALTQTKIYGVAGVSFTRKR